MRTSHHRNVVLGGGAVGTAAAYHLARAGEPVTLVEQFELGHDRGSSHGAARITRHSYADPRYARRMLEAFRLWRELEADAGCPLYVRTGGVSFCPPGVDYARRVAGNLAAIEIPHRLMSGRELNRRVRAFGVPDDSDVVFEPDAGMLAAARIVRVQVERAQEIGPETTVLERTPATRIDLEARRPTLVLFDGSRIEAERLVVAAGPWVSQLLPGRGLPARVTRQQVLYLRPEAAGPYAIGELPVFIAMGAEAEDAYYGMPPFLGRGVKVARHGGPEVDPDRAGGPIDASYIAQIRRFLRGSVPGLAEAEIADTEVCLYTEAPDEGFRVGALPSRGDVIVASPCSGHGFKFANLVGAVVAELAMTGQTTHDAADWRLSDEQLG